MRCVCVCVSGCQPVRWCCVTAAVQPLELAAHNDTLDILMMPACAGSTTDSAHLHGCSRALTHTHTHACTHTHSLSAHLWPFTSSFNLRKYLLLSKQTVAGVHLFPPIFKYPTGSQIIKLCEHFPVLQIRKIWKKIKLKPRKKQKEHSIKTKIAKNMIC